ncbi:hypothetical protein CJ030_MR5G023972 [Morella rubra]|uniref:Uncharacterized protein n=1 Tax=Morella rubra TaxID=262757 RepID=A0A6A1VNA3_9ROSI|nr:hypothetical protein CJ030_MR5G023972 [Morella rubra]
MSTQLHGAKLSSNTQNNLLKIDPAELYKKRKKHYKNSKGETWVFHTARENLEKMEAFELGCEIEGNSYTELARVLANLVHQLERERTEIELVQTAKEKEISELKARQTEIENILREQWERQEIQEMQLLECEEMPEMEHKKIRELLRLEMEMQLEQKVDKFMKQMHALHS